MPYKPWDRPTGKQKDDYVDHAAWPPARWAWEFLRRNTKFQEACNAIQDNPDARHQQKRIAGEFGLRRFKDYRDEFKGITGQPRFVGRIRIMSNPFNEPDARRRRMSVGPASVVISFDLSAELQRKGAVDAQIAAAGKYVRKMLPYYLEDVGKPASQTEGPEAQPLLRSLRLLDLLHSRTATNRLQALEIANDEDTGIPKAIREGNKDEMIDKYKHQIGHAKDLAEEKYRFLGSMTWSHENDASA